MSVSLKLVIDNNSHQVLYAEAGKEFIDFLFTILALPVATFFPILNQEIVGSLGIIYESFKNFSPTYLQPYLNQYSLMYPTVYFPGNAGGLLQLPSVQSSTSRKFYRCVDGHAFVSHFVDQRVINNSSALCPKCGKNMDRLVNFVDRSIGNKSSSFNEGGYVKGVVTYMVMDDLAVKPLSTFSISRLLKQFQVMEIGALEEKVVHLGKDEVGQTFFLSVHNLFFFLFFSFFFFFLVL